VNRDPHAQKHAVGFSNRVFGEDAFLLDCLFVSGGVMNGLGRGGRLAALVLVVIICGALLPVFIIVIVARRIIGPVLG